MNDTQKKMIEKFQCPGCACGSSTTCPIFKFSDEYGFRCESHTAGTHVGRGPNSLVILGLPKGFNKVGAAINALRVKQNINNRPKTPLVRLWEKGKAPEWNRLNIPVWAFEEGGYLYVRTYVPLINIGFVDVIEDGSLDMVPAALNVKDFINEID